MKHIHLIFIASAIAASGCATTSKAPKQAELPAEKLEIIDAHTHISAMGFEEGKEKATIVKDYLEEWKANGVVGGVIHTGDLNKGYTADMNANVVQCAGIREKILYSELEAGLKNKKYGCVKIYLGYVRRYAYDEAYLKVYRIAEKYKVPVVFHTGDTLDADGGLKYADPLTVDEVAVKFRKVKFVIAHCGYPWIESAAEVAYKNENVYLDGSAFLIGDLAKTESEKVDEYVVKPLKWVFGYVENPNKLMFGTDWPLTRVSPYVEAFKKAIPQQYWKKVFHDNAVEVFGFKKAQVK